MTLWALKGLINLCVLIDIAATLQIWFTFNLREVMVIITFLAAAPQNNKVSNHNAESFR